MSTKRDPKTDKAEHICTEPCCMRQRGHTGHHLFKAYDGAWRAWAAGYSYIGAPTLLRLRCLSGSPSKKENK